MPDRETFQQLKNIGKDRRYSIRERRISHKPFHLQENNGIDRRSKERRSASHENIISRKPFQLPENNGKDRRLTIFIIALLLVIVAMILSVSAVVRSYGPYLGRVVDAETGIPLANVEVLIRFYTEYHLQLEEPTSQVAEAIETLREFGARFVYVFGSLANWVLAITWNRHIHISVFLVLIPLISAITMLPVSINGIGIREGCYAMLFPLAGLSIVGCTWGRK